MFRFQTGRTSRVTIFCCPTKQSQKIIFSRKTSQRNHPGIMFNNSIANVTTTHKHLGLIFDSKLSFNTHLKSVLKKISKTVGLL